MKSDLAFSSDSIILKYFPKVLDFFLKSTTTSKIDPFNTETYFSCANLVCKCIPLKTFFLELEVQPKIKFLFLKNFFL